MKNKNKVLGTEVGKFCLDVAKLIIGGVILASIVKEDLDSMLLISIGSLFVLILTIVGLWLISHYKDEGDDVVQQKQEAIVKNFNKKRRK